MDWNVLLCADRLNQIMPKDSVEFRSPFKRDYDKIIYTSAFRRLQGKTQVHSLPSSDFIHNRLTHSLEVSTVGFSLGLRAAKLLKKDYKDEVGNFFDLESKLDDEKRNSESDLGYIVAAACLGHDIGNPPFGHAGEDAISQWFTEKLSPHLDNIKQDKLNELQISDLQQFEGNAQGLRLLTKNIMKPRSGGLQLTYATLGTLLKYPRNSSAQVQWETLGNYSTQKFNYLQSESDIFNTITQKLYLIEKEVTPGITYYARHPLAYLMEAADDICNLVIDIEDGYRLKMISYNEAEDSLRGLISKSSENIENHIQGLTENDQISNLRSLAIGDLTHDCFEEFKKNLCVIMKGDYSHCLFNQIPQKQKIEEIKSTIKKKLYQNRDVLEVQIAGADIISGLLDSFIPAVLNYENTPKSHSQRKICDFLKSYIDPNNELESKLPYDRILLVTDFISGMTDQFALKLHRQLTGVSL